MSNSRITTVFFPTFLDSLAPLNTSLYKLNHYAFIMLSFSHPCQHILWYTFLLVTEFTYWWFGVVLSQVIPSEVQDNTGDNIEKPGKTPNA